MTSKKTLIGWSIVSLVVVSLFGLIQYGDWSGLNKEQTPENNVTAPIDNGGGKKPSAEETSDLVSPGVSKARMPLKVYDSRPYISLNQLIDEVGGEIQYDSMEGTIRVSLLGRIVELLRDAPVLSVDGVFLPTKDKPYIEHPTEEVFIPANYERFFNGIGFTIPEQISNDVVVEWKSTQTEQKPVDTTVLLNLLHKERMVEYLSFLVSPIENSLVSTRESHLPGAPRAYRNGLHEGMDWYFDQQGKRVDETTAVLAQADGVIVRADWDYVEFTFEQREQILELSHTLPHTPQYILDQLRGRSVWVQYEKGVMVRYAHLHSIYEGIEIGARVTRGQVIGYVGNSGTSSGVKGNEDDYHLHMDLLIYGQLFWEKLDSEDIKEVLTGVFNK
jgi:murein DD-endopeptidase MepM/ murein hydrolase activator NlpD